jgi:hypothetical protein
LVFIYFSQKNRLTPKLDGINRTNIAVIGFGKQKYKTNHCPTNKISNED